MEQRTSIIYMIIQLVNNYQIQSWHFRATNSSGIATTLFTCTKEILTEAAVTSTRYRDRYAEVRIRQSEIELYTT